MRNGFRMLISLMLMSLAIASSCLHAENAPPDSGAVERTAVPTVTLLDRPIVSLRATVAGVSPEVRRDRAEANLASLNRTELALPVQWISTSLGGDTGVAFRIGNHLVFSYVANDREPGDSTPFDADVRNVADRLQQAMAARRDQMHWPVLIRGAALTLLATALLGMLGWGIARLRAWAYAGMQRILEAHLLSRTSRGFDWTGTAYHLARQLVQLLALCLFTLLLYLWLIFVLERFPASQPMGSRLGAFLLGMLNRIALACVEALPGIITAIVIFLITRAVHAMVNNIFAAALRGRLDLPGLHQETAGATRRVVVLLVWALGFVFAYPYLPGSQSDVFKGLSVLFGFMITLGSAGIVNQLMSGMVVIYSRALKRGDFVALGENIGTVVSIDTLSVKLVNVRNEEITIPYALVVASPIVNYSRHAADLGALVATTVTIGYDTPWRQVHAMLLAAASRMKHVAMTPAPFVVQRALSDYYVEYELMVAIADPTLRPLALSSLHAEIQDEFNRNGVQIMSPHFMAQPEEPVLVKPGQWQDAGHGGT